MTLSDHWTVLLTRSTGVSAWGGGLSFNVALLFFSFSSLSLSLSATLASFSFLLCFWIIITRVHEPEDRTEFPSPTFCQVSWRKSNSFFCQLRKGQERTKRRTQRMKMATFTPTLVGPGGLLHSPGLCSRDAYWGHPHFRSDGRPQ